MAVKEAAQERGTCLFSGEATGSKRSRFLPGYDAKMKGLLLSVVRGESKVKDIPKRAIPALRSTEGLVGFQLKGDSLVQINGKPAPKAKAVAPTTKTVKKLVKKVKKAKPVAEESEGEEFDGAED